MTGGGTDLPHCPEHSGFHGIAQSLACAARESKRTIAEVNEPDQVRLLPQTSLKRRLQNLSRSNCFLRQDLQDLQDFMNAGFFVGFKILSILLILSKRGFASTYQKCARRPTLPK